MAVPYSMKAIYSVLIFILLSPVFAQEYEVQGNIQLVSYSQGGVELMPEAYMPYPAADVKMFVVQYNGADKKPTVIRPIKSDSTGRFEITLPEGEYGFLLTRDKTKFKDGQYLPEAKGNGVGNNPEAIDIGDGYGYQDYWVMNCSGPFKVRKDGINQVTITHYMVSICYMCP